MSNEEIKLECENAYLQIKEAEEKLKSLRSQCKHEKTFEGLYSWRVGATAPCIICSYCGEVVKQISFALVEPVPNLLHDRFPQKKQPNDTHRE